MSDKFIYRRDNTDGVCRIVLQGIIDEDAILENVFDGAGPTVEIDLRGVTRINSCGIRTWVNCMAELSSLSQVRFINCPPIIIRQFNMIANFGGKARIISFLIPYYCPRCDKECDIDTTTENYKAHFPDFSVPIHQCPSCGTELEFDDIAEKYFHFLKQ